MFLETATLLSGAGNGAAAVILPWLVLERTGSAAAAGLLAASTAIPLLGSSLFSGTVVDRIGRRRTSIGSDVLSAMSVAAIPLVDRWMGLHLGWIVALAVIGAVFDPAGVTARETMLPGAAARGGLVLERVNSVHEAIWSVAFLIGPGIGGVLISWVGAADALWITSFGFATSALCVGLMGIDATDPVHAGEEPEHGILAGTREGLRFVWNDRLLRGLTLITAALVSVYMPIEGVLLPVHFEELGQPGRLGVVIMAMSVGGIVGALGYAAAAGRARRSLVLRAALVVTSVFLVVLALLPPFGVMLGACFVIGVAYGPVGPLTNLAMQTRSPEGMRGRVVGIITSTEYAAGPVGYLLTGAATEAFGVRPTFVTIAGLILAIALAGVVMRSLGEFDRLPRRAVTGVADLLDEATAGPLPLVLPPRDR